MINKVILILGILGALYAAEGLNRIVGLVTAFGSVGAPIPLFILIMSLVSAGILLLGLFNKSHKITKWIMFVVLLGCNGLMFVGPSFPVHIQVIVGLMVTTVSTAFIRTKYETLSDPDKSSSGLSPLKGIIKKLLVVVHWVSFVFAALYVVLFLIQDDVLTALVLGIVFSFAPPALVWIITKRWIFFPWEHKKD